MPSPVEAAGRFVTQDMSGEKDIAALLASLKPALDAEIYTFATVPGTANEWHRRPLAIFREPEGLSVICLLREAQEADWKHEGEFQKITLTVHSSLHAIGLTARVSTALADRGIPCNVVAGFYHDHLFVPVKRANEAMRVLSRLR